MKRLLALSLLLAIATAPVAAQDPAAPKSDAALLQVLEAAKADAARLRGLPFLYDVPVRKITAGDFQKQMSRDIRRVFGEGDDLAHMEMLLRRLRVLPEDMSIHGLTTGFFPATVAANYDPTGKRISFLKTYRSPETMKKLMVHELTHALQDQHFNLMLRTFSGEMTFDRLLALGALVEGDAEDIEKIYETNGMLLMTPLEMIRKLGEAGVEQYLKRMKGFPRGIARPFIFQYLDGLLFIETVKRARGGNHKVIDQVFLDPPVSTEQVLHPGRYLHRDRPTRISLPKPPDGYEVLVSNVLGELGVSIVLRENLGGEYDPKAAEGWDGDRILLLREKETGSTVLAWITTWDSPGDAAEFTAAAKAMLKARHPDVEWTEEGTDMLGTDLGTHMVVSKANDVLIVEGAPEGAVIGFIEALTDAKKEQLVLRKTRFGSNR